MTGIYEIVNNINGKIYIGQSVNIYKRWSNHKSSDLDYPLYRAFKKYGIENFSFNVLEETSVENLSEREKYWIDKKNSFKSGYNQTQGGEQGFLNSITWEDVEEATRLLKETDLTQSQIADLIEVDISMINGMNTGRCYKRDIEYPIREYPKGTKHFCLDCGVEISKQSTRCMKCYSISTRVHERPDKEWLIKNIAERGFSCVAREFGVSDNSIKKWCKSYDIPHLIDDIKKLHENYVEKVKRLKASNLKVERNGEEFLFQDTSEMASYIIKNKLSKAQRHSITSSCSRLARGDRKSYLGFKLKIS